MIEEGPVQGEAMNRMFRETLPTLFAGLAILFGLLAAINYSFFPEDGLLVSLVELALAVIFAGAWIVTRSVTIPLPLVHPLGVFVAWMVLGSNLVHFADTEDAWKCVETTLIVVGLGCLLLSRAWFVVALAGIHVSWYLVARRILSVPELKAVGYSLLAATALSALIQEARIRIFQRLENLRLSDAGRKVDLQEALDASEHELQERKRTEMALRESEARYRLLVEMAPVAIIVHVAGLTRFVNRSALDLLRMQRPEDLVGKPVLRFIHPSDHGIAMERMRRVLDLRLPSALGEIRMLRPDGEVIEVEIAGAPIQFEGETAAQIALLDVTQRKRTDERLRVMQFAIDHAGEALIWMDHETRIVYANIQACEILDYTMKELLELHLGDLDPKFQEESSAFGERSLEWGKTVTLEREFRRRNGSVFPAEITVNRLRHETINVYVIFMRDITERKRTEQALRQSEERFRTVFEEGPLGMAIIDTDLRFVRVNAMLCQLLGYSPAQLKEMRFSDLTLEGLENYDRDVTRRLIRGEAPSIEMNLKWRGSNGREVWVRVNATIIREPTGAPLYGLAMVEDVTRSRLAEADKQRLEDQLRQAQKMEAVGTLAGGVAHDFNNLLTGILGYATILKGEARPGSRIYNAAEIIEKAGERARDLTSQLLGFARKGKNQNIAINLEHTIRDVISLLKRTIPKSIEIRQSSEGAEFFVQGDPNQLEQVFLNLALNARDAMPQGGRLSFHTGIVLLGEEFSRQNPGMSPGSYVQVEVADTGTGIPREHQERIFEPFFTTKELGQGTGMGLAMVYGIVKNHGGAVRVESESGRGAIFRVQLPLYHPAETKPSIEEPETPLKGEGRILIVDDEEVVRNILREMLQTLGYEVVLATGGREAVAYFDKFWREIDLVILDMIMPEMGGRECFMAMRAIHPGVRAVLSTGYGRDGAAQEIINTGMIGFAQKPYRIDQLSQVVHRALREPLPQTSQSGDVARRDASGRSPAPAPKTGGGTTR